MKLTYIKLRQGQGADVNVQGQLLFERKVFFSSSADIDRFCCVN